MIYAVRCIRLGGVAKYLEITVYNGLLQSAASNELGAQYDTAMTSATDNGRELIES